MQLAIAELGLVAILNENPPMYTFMTIGIPFFQYISALISSMKIEI